LRVGRGLGNDLILLDAELAETEGVFQTRGRDVFWKPVLGGELDCRKEGVRIGRYGFRLGRTPAYRAALCAAGLLVAAAGVVSWFPPSKGETAVSGSPSVAIPLPARGVYGRVSDDGAVVERLTFRFEHDGTDGVLLHYVPGRILRADQLLVELNGNPAGFVPLCRDGWGIEQRLLLPQRQLAFGTNRISFVLQRPSSETGRWGVRDVYVTGVPAAGAEGEDGYSLLAAAERAFQEGEGSPGKLARSRELMRQAIDTFRLGDRKIPSRAVFLERDIVNAQHRLYSKWMSEARKAARLGDVRRAGSIYRRLLSEWTDPSDLRRVEIGRALEDLRP
jgi:hypothetical protein